MKVRVDIGARQPYTYDAPWPVAVGERVVVPVSIGGVGDGTEHIWGEVVELGSGGYTGYCRPLLRKRQPRDRQAFLGETVSS